MRRIGFPSEKSQYQPNHSSDNDFAIALPAGGKPMACRTNDVTLGVWRFPYRGVAALLLAMLLMATLAACGVWDTLVDDEGTHA